MSWRRVMYLLPVHCHGATRGLWVLLVLFACGVGPLTLGVGWDGAYVRVFGVTEDGFGAVPDRETGVRLVVTNYYSWAWVVACLVYALPGGLLPMAAAYSPTHTLWLRGLPCRPREVAVARAARLVAVVGLTAVPSLVWVAVMAAYHGLDPGALLVVVLGWVAHLVLAGGLVLAVGPWPAAGVERAACAFAALLLPPVLFLSYLGLAHRLGDGPWEAWYPYAAPLTHNFAGAWKHYASAAAVGCGLVLWSCLGARGRLVGPVSGTREG